MRAGRICIYLKGLQECVCPYCRGKGWSRRVLKTELLETAGVALVEKNLHDMTWHVSTSYSARTVPCFAS